MTAAPDKPSPPTQLGAKHVAAVLAAAALATPLTLASEGLVTKTAADPVGIPTACWGHAHAEAGKTYTLDQCEQMAALDLARAGAGIAPCITVPVADKTRAAFTDFAFNVGAAAFCSSTMAKKLNDGDTMGACAELSRWVYADGKPFPGLVTRRAAERKLCEEGATQPPPAPPTPIVAAAMPKPAPAISAQPAKPNFLTRLKEWFA